jgi:hypothetical protein
VELLVPTLPARIGACHCARECIIEIHMDRKIGWGAATTGRLLTETFQRFSPRPAEECVRHGNQRHTCLTLCAGVGTMAAGGGQSQKIGISCRRPPATCRGIHVIRLNVWAAWERGLRGSVSAAGGDGEVHIHQATHAARLRVSQLPLRPIAGPPARPLESARQLWKESVYT